MPEPNDKKTSSLSNTLNGVVQPTALKVQVPIMWVLIALALLSGNPAILNWIGFPSGNAGIYRNAVDQRLEDIEDLVAENAKILSARSALVTNVQNMQLQLATHQVILDNFLRNRNDNTDELKQLRRDVDRIQFWIARQQGAKDSRTRFKNQE